MEDKFNKLKNIIKSLNSVVIAFSGGIDSTLLAKIAFDILGDNAIAVTGISDTLIEKEFNEAKEIANHIGIKHLIINTLEMENQKFINNDAKRCYYCKIELFSKLKKIALENNLSFVIEGSNFNDKSDYRPGMIAAKELDIRAPFVEAGITKEEIRNYAKALDLPNWNKPSSPCLSSRVAYGEDITLDKLKRIEKGEEFLKNKNLLSVRVRNHGNIARIEVNKNEFNKIIKLSDEISLYFKEIGFSYITLDLEGYRMGSMNEILKTTEKIC
jgi:uncharacterized protein